MRADEITSVASITAHLRRTPVGFRGFVVERPRVEAPTDAPAACPRPCPNADAAAPPTERKAYAPDPIGRVTPRPPVETAPQAPAPLPPQSFVTNLGERVDVVA